MRGLKGLSLWTYQQASPKVFILAAVVFIFFMAVVLPRVSESTKAMTGTGESLDTSLFYSAEDIYRMAEEYGEEGRTYYIKSRFTFDIAWPLAYLLFLASSLSLAFRSFPAGSAWRLLNLLPFGGVLFDFLENGGAAILMYRYPIATPGIAEVTPIFTFMKWMFIGASMLALAGGIILAGLRRLRSHV